MATTPSKPLTVASLLRRYAADYVARHPGQAVPQVQSTLAKLSLCRTAALGSRRYCCDACDTECTVYNSCGDRHCPQCSGARRADWLSSTAALLLPGIEYFQVVFTIPDTLSALTLGNRRALYDLLFTSAWESLRGVIAEEQGFAASAAMVLHTWNQRLEPHAHVHAVVPGSGPSLRGERRWVTSHRRDVPRARAPYLVDADTLRQRFRQTFLTGLRRLHQQGALKLTGTWSLLQSPAAFERWLAPLEQVDWVTYIEPPPHHDSAPEHVLKYLARYLTGGPISDRRLISATNGNVTFWARAGQKSGGDRHDQQPCEVPGAEFVRLWSLHILPKGFVKTRRYGGYSNRRHPEFVTAYQELREQPDSAIPDESPSLNKSPAVEPTEPVCAHCGGPMRCLAARIRDDWYTVMTGPDRPRWYLDGS